MFDQDAFHSWPLVVAGAILFAALFVLLALMAEFVFEETFRLTWRVIGLGAGAFGGYLGVAWILRRDAAAPR